MHHAVQRTPVEWLETDGLGGFASGPVRGPRTRRYHALLLVATKPPVGRCVLVNGLEVHAETVHGRRALSTQRYTPDVLHPDGDTRFLQFTSDPWPSWRYRLEDGIEIVHEILVEKSSPAVTCRWRVEGSTAGVRLYVRPLLSCRDAHALHRENPAFQFAAGHAGDRVCWHPYAPLPPVHARHNGAYVHQPEWYRNFLYTEEQARGLDAVEDLASPGEFRFDLAVAEAELTFSTAIRDAIPRARERARRETLGPARARLADAFLVRRDSGVTIVAGYPWFTDWGRDTFIALPGLCLARGRHAEARQILLAWAGTVSQGMLPNRFAEGGQPEFNSVDASLWFVVAVHHLLASQPRLPPAERARLVASVRAIVEGYALGTRHRIGLAEDGLLACGEPGVQLTWMDAKVGDHVVTPRIGKPVEVQALWLNTCAIADELLEPGGPWRERFSRGCAEFARRFWNPETACLFDVVDVDHRAGHSDPAIRPNQVFAVGGLPFAVLEGDRARAVLEVVTRELLTPAGLRTLSPRDPRYIGRYEGGVRERDAAYHMGTAWPWLLGPYAAARQRVDGERWPIPFLPFEIADGDAPHMPRGCPWQAWSVAAWWQLSATRSRPLRHRRPS